MTEQQPKQMPKLIGLVKQNNPLPVAVPANDLMKK
jgi:hypothetical protein